MTLPLKVVIFDPGAGGAPTQTNPRDLSGWATEYSDSNCNEFGAESLTLTGYVDSIEAAIDFTQRLMSSVEVYTPAGRPRFFGFLHSVTVPVIHCSVSMEDLANVVILRYTTPNNVKGTATATNAPSIARYGRKEIVLNYSDVLAAEATNRAAMILAQISEPPNTQSVSIEPGEKPPFRVDLTFRGWAETLKWVTTANTTQTTAVTSTQVTGLITAYNLVNAFFDTAGAQVTSTAFSATQYCPPDTTYYDRIQTLLSAGNSSQQRVAWGFFTRALTLGVSASAAPDTIAYSYSWRRAELRDANGNIIPEWDWAPDCMVQNVDAIVPPAPTGALATLTRKCIRRVTLRIGSDGLPHGTMEPDDVKNLPSFLAKPVSVDAGVSARHAAIEARIAKAVRSRTFNTDNNTSFDGGTGVVLPPAGGTGIPNAGTITAPHNVDLGTGAGVGGPGSSAAIGTGTAGRIAEWLSSSTLQASSLIKSGVGVLTLAASTAETLTITDGGTLDLNGAVLTLGANFTTSGGGAITLAAGGAYTLTIPKTGTAVVGGGTTGNIAKWSDANTITNAIAGTDYGVGTVAGTGTAGRLTQWASGGVNIENSTLIKGGAGVLTLSASTTETITIASAGGGTIDLNGAVLTLGANFTTSGGGAITLASGGTFTLTIPKTGTAVVGSGTTGNIAKWSDANTITNAVAGTDYGTGTVEGTGTAGRLMQWASGGANAENSTLIKSGAGVLTLSAGSTYTLTIPATGTAVLGTGTNTRLAEWSGTNTLQASKLIKSGSNVLQFDLVGGDLTVTVTNPSGSPVGMVLGEGNAGQIAYFNLPNVVGTDAALQWDSTNNSLSIGTGTVSNTRLTIKGSSTSSSNYGIYYVNSASTNVFNVRDDGAGWLFAASWTYGSDERGKENITDITRGLAHLRQLRPVRFDYIDGPQNQLGFVAQELRTVIPELVVPVDPNDPSPEPMLGVLTNNLIPIIVAAIKDIAQQIIAIRNRLDAGGL